MVDIECRGYNDILKAHVGQDLFVQCELIRMFDVQQVMKQKHRDQG